MKNCLQSYLLFLFFVFFFNSSFGQISFEENFIDGGLYVNHFDYDNDGDIDILGYVNDQLIIWNNNGSGSFSDSGTITVSGLVDTTIADFDGDGLLDIALTLYNNGLEGIRIYRNIDAQGDFQITESISSNINDVGAISSGDLDNDGDIDLVVSFSDDDDFFVQKIVWYRNLDGQANLSSQIEIDDILVSKSIIVVNIDEDSDLDIVTIDGANWVKIYKNSNGIFSNSESIFRSNSFVRNVIAERIDSDADLDIVMTHQNKNEVVWHENLNFNDDFGTRQAVSSDTNSPQFVVGGDIDNDGDIDLVTFSNFGLPEFEPRLAWHENIDNQDSFANDNLIEIDSSISTGGKIGVADFDNDGLLDIITNGLYWFKNLGFTSNKISGTIQYDLNSNGCDDEGVNPINLMVETSNGIDSFSTFSLNNGFYQLFTNEGDFTTSILQLPSYYQSTPASYISNFTGLGNTDTADFCIIPTTTVNDLQISVYPSQDDPRPGFDTTYQLVYNNIGTTQLSGTITFEYDNTKLNFLSASETVTNQTANTLTFSYSDFNPFETRTIDLEFNVFAPPTTNIDDILVSTAVITPVTDDENEEDNNFILSQTVIGSYDPNDIRVLEGDEILIDDIDKYLHYIIRFQNTGTASAINVKVNHVLDDKLDWQTMQLESLSHDGRVEIIDGSEVSFIFNNINLPDSTNDEPNSHGFIAFKIKPKNDVIVGDIINGVADIFFDFNPAITTNTVNTEIVEENLSTNEFNVVKVKLYPNPTSSELIIKGVSVIDNIDIYDINGRLLKTYKSNDIKLTIDVRILSEGIYFLEIQSGSSKQTTKFIKQ